MTVVTTVTQSCSDAQSGGNQEKLGQVLFFTPLESMLVVGFMLHCTVSQWFGV